MFNPPNIPRDLIDWWKQTAEVVPFRGQAEHVFTAYTDAPSTLTVGTRISGEEIVVFSNYVATIHWDIIAYAPAENRIVTYNGFTTVSSRTGAPSMEANTTISIHDTGGMHTWAWQGTIMGAQPNATLVPRVAGYGASGVYWTLYGYRLRYYQFD